MLVLSRRPNQSIVISSDIIVTVIEIRGDQVRLGIKAPRSVTVHRDEVAAEIKRANQEAAAGPPASAGTGSPRGLPRPPAPPPTSRPTPPPPPRPT